MGLMEGPAMGTVNPPARNNVYILFAHQRLNVKHARSRKNSKYMNTNYEYEWISGLTDGDGTFSFSLNNKEKLQWNCTFKIGASDRNAQMLHFCRQILGRGSVNLRAGKGGAEFRIRDRKVLKDFIVPFFRQHPLYTTKAFYFERWRMAINILECKALSNEEKNKQLGALRGQHPPSTYRAPAWDCVARLPGPRYAKKAPSKGWVCGFIEAEGSFFITNKAGSFEGKEDRFVHSFGITQKLDPHILEHIRGIFHISASVLLRCPAAGGAYYRLESSNSRSLLRIRRYFKGAFRGRKSLEFRIWERTLKWRGESSRLKKIQQLLRNLRQIPPV